MTRTKARTAQPQPSKTPLLQDFNSPHRIFLSLIPNLINAIPLQDAQASSEIENILTTEDALFRAAGNDVLKKNEEIACQLFKQWKQFRP